MTNFEELKPKVTPLLRELSFIKASSAHFNDYQGAIVHGALLPRVRLRLHYLVEQWLKSQMWLIFIQLQPFESEIAALQSASEFLSRLWKGLFWR